MEKKKTLLIIAVLLVVLLAGATMLYSGLSDKVENNSFGIIAEESVEKEENEATGETSEEETGNETTGDTSEEETKDETDDEATGEELMMAPDFTVTDAEGNEVKLSDFLGKPVILNFWASWCGPCKSEMPDFEEAYKEYAEEIQFVMVNLTDGSRETVETASAYVSEQGYSFPVYYDTQSDAAMTYQVFSVPTTYFMDAEGYLTAQAQGAIDRETLQKGIDMIYKAEGSDLQQ